MTKKEKDIGAMIWMGLLLLFSFIPGSFINYGYDYFSFLTWGITLAICVVAVGFLVLPCPDQNLPKCLRLILLWLLPLTAMALFWIFRTRIHCFGGDGAVGILPSLTSINLSDFLPALPPRRLDGYLMGVTKKLLLSWGFFEKYEVMPSILTVQVYSVVIGGLFVAVCTFVFRRNLGLLFTLLTFPFLFNFFGNIDSYAFSLLVAAVFMAVAIWVDRSDRVKFLHLAVLSLVWLIGLWTHPFHLFSGFLVAYEGTRFLHGFMRFRKLHPGVLPGLYGLVFFCVVKCSQFSNAFFAYPLGGTPPSFSLDTFTHYLNMILIPMLPFIALNFFSRSSIGRVRLKMGIFAIQSGVFFIMAFTLGAADQFNYQHLLFFFLMPWLVLGSVESLGKDSCRTIIAINLFLLIPMIAVHSTSRTIQRARALYPIDPCQHNLVMSWQTHLGLALADNLQTDKNVKNACLAVFRDGASRAIPAGFRGGNLVYYTAFLYHFGEIEKGRTQLYTLLKNNEPANVVRFFLSPRPAFIYCNRKQLWDDIETYLKETRSPLLHQFIAQRKVVENKAISERYYVRKPSYAITNM